MPRNSILTALTVGLAFGLSATATQAQQAGPAVQPSNSVFIGDLTWDEIRDHLLAGKTTAIIATAGTEQNGPHMVMGKHRYILEYTADKIARGLGNALVAPIVTYVPEGSWENPGGHMSKAGTITLPNPMFMELLTHAAKSLEAGGFTEILFIGDSGGNQNGMRDVAAALNEEWAGTGSAARWIGDYYGDPEGRTERYITGELGIPGSEIGSHAGISDTSQLMFINANHIRWDRLAPNGGMEDSGVRGNPTLASPEIGRVLLDIKIDNALRQIRGLEPTDQVPSGPGSDPGVRAGLPTGSPLPSRSIEALTWTEIRAAIDGGMTGVIVPIGGTEQNGPHMVMGKHNFIVTKAAEMMAERLGNALIAPTIQYVPEGSYASPNFGAKPGVITNPGESYNNLLEAAARSLAVHGFTDIMLIGDSGGNQGGMSAVAETLNAEWEAAGSPARVYSLNDYYSVARGQFQAWLLAEYGYDTQTIGSHAGISDTSQLLWVHPEGIRLEKRAPGSADPDAGVSGDPTLATAEIGRMGVEFKVNAALAQYRSLKNPGRRGGRGGRGGGRGGGGGE